MSPMSADVVLLVLRLVVGGLLAAHGAQKLFGWFGGFGLRATGGYLACVQANLWRPGMLVEIMVTAATAPG